MDQQTGTIDTGDVTLFFRRFGTPGATPVLIVHGLSYFSYDWIEVASDLANGGHDVVAMDMRGFGDSTWSPGHAYGIGDYAGDCIAVLDHVGWDRVNLMGHSMGGRNCTWCAAEYPDRVESLILCDYSPVNAAAGSNRVATTVAGVPDFFESVEDALAYFGKARDLAADDPRRLRMEAYLKPVSGGFVIKRDPFHRERFRKVLGGTPAPAGPDMWAALARVRCPVLVVRGSRSDMFAAETVQKVRDANGALTLVEVDASHDVAGDAPKELVAEVINFLGART